jgi:hypothetical protein
MNRSDVRRIDLTLELGHLFLESDAAAWHEESAETPKMGECRKTGVGASDYKDFELCEVNKLRSISLPSSLPSPLCKNRYVLRQT